MYLNEIIDLIIKDYKKCKYDRDAICDMLGLKKSAYSERIKKAKEKASDAKK